MLFIVKIIVSILLVIVLSEISKRISPFLGGVLLGLPLGIGLAVFFIAQSEGIPYVVSSVPWGIAGLAPAMLFCTAYLFSGIRIENRVGSVLLATLTGLAFFLGLGYLLSLAVLNIYLSLAIFIFAYFINLALVKKIYPKQDAAVKAPQTKERTWLKYLVRGLISGLITVLVTGIASIAGSRWAGVLSSFPATTFSLMIVLHIEAGNSLYPQTIKGFSFGVCTLAAFYILCCFILPAFGLILGYVIIYCGCFLFIFIIKAITDKINLKS